MSELNINDLPPEILLTVFRYLDVVEWKNATLTCKLWNSLIESGCRWILSLNNFCSRNEQKENFVLTTNRKFGTMTIRGYRISENNQILQTSQNHGLDRKFGTMTIRESHVSEISQLFKIIQRHGFNVVKLNLRSCYIRDLVAFAKFLNLTPNLEYVNMQSVQYFGGTNSLTDAPLDHFLPDLKKLKTLKIIATNYWTVKCFQKAKLTTIRIEGSWEHGNLHSLGHVKAWLVDFLSSQDMLTLLILICDSRQSIAIDLGKSNVPVQFRLKQLAVFIEHDSSEDFYYEIRNVLKFVKSQAQYLTELELSGIGMPASVYEFVFTSMGKLDTLIFGLEHFGYMDVSYIKHLPENCSVRNLQLNDAFWYSSHNYDIFFKKLPNIQSLSLPGIVTLSEDILVTMADNLTKLESLFVYSIDEVSVECMKFLNLKSLRIQCLSVRVNWSDFTKIHARLTEIAIETIRPVSTFTSDDVDQIATNVDLQSIRLGAGFVADDRFFDVIRTKCKNVKMVELHKSCISHMENSGQIKALRLYDDINRSWYSHRWGEQEYEV